MRKPSPSILHGGTIGLALVAGGLYGHLGVDGLAWAALPAAAAAGLFVLARCQGGFSAQAADGGAVTELVRMAADQSGEGLLIATWDGAVLHANDRFRQLFFIDPEADQPPAEQLLDWVAGALDGQGRSPDLFRRLRDSARAGEADGGEVICRSPEGKPEWRSLNVEGFGDRDADGIPRYVQWRARDVTEEKRQGASRQSADARRADLLDRLPAAVFSVDEHGRIIYANFYLADWLRVDRMSLNGRPFADFVVSADPGGNGEDGDDRHGTVTLRAGDGTEFSARLLQSQRETEDRNLVYTRSILLRDAEDLRGTVQAAVQTVVSAVSTVSSGGAPSDPLGPARRLRFLFDDAPVAIVLLDAAGRVTDCNRAFTGLTGLHREAAVGRSFAERLLPEDRDGVASALTDVVMGRVRASQTEIRLAGGGGRQPAATVFASRMEGDQGQLLGLVLHFVDTTEQKNLELQFAQSQKMQAVGQLAGGVAHDFNNLLTAMIGFTDLLLERHGPGDPSFNDLQQIKQNAHRATNLVRQLLAFSRKQNLEPDLLDPEDALNDISNLLRRLLGENVRLKLEHERGAGKILADRGQFDQVIINMAVNARDAMPDGGPLVIRTLRQDLDKPLSQGGEMIPVGAYIVVEVEDQGIGMDKETMDRIFEPFFSTKEVGQGTGLGLSTVYGIIHQSGGYVTVDSTPGRGTIFRLLFPKAEEHAAEDRPDADLEDDDAMDRDVPDAVKAKPGKGRGKKKDQEPELPLFEADTTGSETILLVEDEDAVRMFGARALRNKGYKVLEAQNAEVALDVINGTEKHIDLVVSDVVMPGMDGYNLVKKVRQQLPHVRVILMSGYAEDAFQDQIDADKTLHFLPKPFTLKTLVGKVKEIIISDGPGAG
ncbi:MAG: PAS domain-containing protein [Rhodospirillaceae bacterium]